MPDGYGMIALIGLALLVVFLAGLVFRAVVKDGEQAKENGE